MPLLRCAAIDSVTAIKIIGLEDMLPAIFA